MPQKIFNTFYQAGFECSTHVTRQGKRLDVVAATQHALLFVQDFKLLRGCGIATVREGLRWHLIEKTRGNYDFSSALPIIEAAQRQGIQVIWDLFHFGWPDYLDIFEPEFVNAFGDFAAQFARLLKKEMSETAFVAPVNEISFVAWAGGDAAHLNPFATGRGHELKPQLVRAYLRAADAVLAGVADVRLVSPEPAIHIVGDPESPEDVCQAEEYRSSMFEAWDMLTGRVYPELGGSPHYLDIVGVNYYSGNQWWNHGDRISRHQPEYRPFREILSEIYARYRRPMFISETGAEDEERAGWFNYIAGEVRVARKAGIDLHGICLYPILNHPGWDDDRHCHNGMWDYPRPDGTRELYEPLAEALKEQMTFESETNGNQSTDPKTTRPDLPLSSPLEFCIPAPAAPHEPVR